MSRFSDIAKNIINFDIMDEVSESVAYYGFASFNCSGTDVAQWSIMKETITGTITKREWASGTKHKTKIWDNRAALTYKYLQS